MSKVLFSLNEKLEHADLNAIGDIVEKTVWDEAMAALFRETLYGNTGGTSGIISGLGFSVGAGTVSVTKGSAMAYVTAPDAFTPALVSSVLVADALNVSVPLNTDPTNDRIDSIVVTPTNTPDTPSTRQVLTGAALTPTSVNTRVPSSATVQVIQGNPSASPVAPATPSGGVKVGEVGNLANSGGIVNTGFLARRVGVSQIADSAILPKHTTVAHLRPLVTVSAQVGTALSGYFLISVSGWVDHLGNIFGQAAFQSGSAVLNHDTGCDYLEIEVLNTFNPDILSNKGITNIDFTPSAGAVLDGGITPSVASPRRRVFVEFLGAEPLGSFRVTGLGASSAGAIPNIVVKITPHIRHNNNTPTAFASLAPTLVPLSFV